MGFIMVVHEKVGEKETSLQIFNSVLLILLYLWFLELIKQLDQKFSKFHYQKKPFFKLIFRDNDFKFKRDMT